jgi:hypothetical protein
VQRLEQEQLLQFKQLLMAILLQVQQLVKSAFLMLSKLIFSQGLKEHYMEEML